MTPKRRVAGVLPLGRLADHPADHRASRFCDGSSSRFSDRLSGWRSYRFVHRCGERDVVPCVICTIVLCMGFLLHVFTLGAWANGEPVPERHVAAGGVLEFVRPDDFGLALHPHQVLVSSYILPCDESFDYCLYYLGRELEGTNFESAGLRIERRVGSIASRQRGSATSLNPGSERASSRTTRKALSRSSRRIRELRWRLVSLMH